MAGADPTPLTKRDLTAKENNMWVYNSPQVGLRSEVEKYAEEKASKAAEEAATAKASAVAAVDADAAKLQQDMAKADKIMREKGESEKEKVNAVNKLEKNAEVIIKADPEALKKVKAEAKEAAEAKKEKTE